MRRATKAARSTEQDEVQSRKRHLGWCHLLLALLVLFSFGLRMWGLDARGLWWDESLSLHRAQGDLSYILSNRIVFDDTVTTDQHPPLYFLLLHGVLRLAGDSDLALRYPSVFFATLIVPLLYLLGRRLRNERAGLLAALAGALSPVTLWYAQEMRMYTLVTALSVATVYLLWRSFDDQGGPWGTAFGVAVLVAAATHYLFGLVLVFEVLLAITLWARSAQPAIGANLRRRPLRLALAIGLPSVMLVILAAATWRLFPSLPSNRSYVPLTGIMRDMANSYSLGFSVNPDQVWWLVLFFVIVFAVGLVSAWHHPPRDHKASGGMTAARLAILTTLLGYIFIPVLIMWGVSLFTPIYMGSRYILMGSPAFYLGLGLGLDHLAHKWRPVAWFTGAVLVLSMGMSTYRYFSREEYSVKEDYRAAAEFIPKLECVDDIILVVGIESVPAFTHYYKGNLPVVGVPPVGASPDQIAQQMEDYAARYERIWLVQGNDEISDPKGRVPKWAKENMLLLTSKVFAGYIHQVDVHRFKTRDPLGTGATFSRPWGVFGDALALLDYDVRYFDEQGKQHTLAGDDLQHALAHSALGEGAAPVPSGNTISVPLMSRPLAPLADLKTSLRLVDAAGAVAAQRDEIPFLYLPTSQWPLGEPVQHQTYLRVPPGLPPGVYTLRLVVYEAETGEPLAFGDEAEGQNHLDLGYVEIGDWNHLERPASIVPDSGRRPMLTTVFEGSLRLLGYVLKPPSVAVRGESVGIDLYWLAHKAVVRDLAFIIEWEGAGRKDRHVCEATPIGSPYPTTEWGEGDLVRNVLRAPVPKDLPAGPCTVYLSLKDRTTGQRLRARYGPFPLATGRLRLLELVIE